MNDFSAGQASGSAQGTYVFTANLPDQQLRGTLQVRGNDIFLEPASGTCRAAEGTSPVAVNFLCSASGRYESMSLLIDRRNPTERSWWSATYRVQRKREICSEYGVISGRQVCVRSWTEYYDTTEGKRGKLRVRRTA